MRVVVLVECVADTETRIKIAPDGCSLVDGEIKWIVNPYDEYAIEAGLKLIEARGQGEVTVVSVGDDRAQPVLRQCLAMGAHRAVLINEPKLSRRDGLATARALAAAATKLGFDVVLAGKQGVGHDRSQVGVMVAELLDIPHIAVVTKVDFGDGTVSCRREIEGGQEIVESTLPVLITAQKGLNEPRYASLKGIMAAKKKPLDVWSAADLADGAIAPAAEEWLKLALPAPRGEAKILKGEASVVAAELVRLLSSEAGVI